MSRARGRSVLWLRRHGPAAKLLDVGCGNGEFLARMRDLGWDTIGVEPDEMAAQIARKRHGLTIHTGTLETLPAGNGSFDAITLSHVIEHLPDPLTSLKRSFQFLRPGGRLVVVTPNARSLGSRLFWQNWAGWDPPRHLYIFTPRSLESALRAAGFQIERQWTTGRTARWMWDASVEIRRSGRCATITHPQCSSTARFAGHLVRCFEKVTCGAGALGEEIVAVCTRYDAGSRDAESAPA
jgi:SAM-dependent methyltransferase